MKLWVSPLPIHILQPEQHHFYQFYILFSFVIYKFIDFSLKQDGIAFLKFKRR